MANGEERESSLLPLESPCRASAHPTRRPSFFGDAAAATELQLHGPPSNAMAGRIIPCGTLRNTLAEVTESVDRIQATRPGVGPSRTQLSLFAHRSDHSQFPRPGAPSPLRAQSRAPAPRSITSSQFAQRRSGLNRMSTKLSAFTEHGERRHEKFHKTTGCGRKVRVTQRLVPLRSSS